MYESIIFMNLQFRKWVSIVNPNLIMLLQSLHSNSIFQYP